MSKSEKYWEDAALMREQEAHTEAEDAIKQMLRLYDDALDDINGEIDRIKWNYRQRFGLDEETAEYYLSRAARDYNMDSLITRLLEAGSDEERAAILDFIHTDGLSTRAYAARIERFDGLMNNIALRMIALEADLRLVGEGIRKTTYTNNYYRVIDDAARGINMGISFSLIDEAALDEVMSKPWHGKRFSTRIWDNTDRLAKEAQEIVGRYITSGRSLDKAADELVQAFEVEKYHATTLMRTEVAHARSMSDMKSYEDIGAEWYRYMATLDERTCETCGPLDGQRFRLDMAVEGKNYPVMHPRCRCTTTIDMDWRKRRARNPVTGRNEVIDGSVTYEQWRENMTEEEAHAFEVAGRKYRNKAADKKQHEKYREVLGKDVPRGFDKFQELKYNNSEQWAELKKCYREVNWQIAAQTNHSKITSHSMPFISEPNSVTDRYGEDGKISQRRYFGRTGKPRLDIDMNDHGNPTVHPVVPHYHDWKEIGDGNVTRSLEHDKAPERWHKIANKDILR